MAKTKAERAAQKVEWKKKNPEKWKAIQKRSADKSREKNREKNRAAAKARYDEDPSKNLAASKLYYEKNKIELRAKSRARNKARYANDPAYRERLKTNSIKDRLKNGERNRKREKAWRERNPGFQWSYTKARLASDPQFAIAHRVRCRISTALRRGLRGTKSARSVNLLGCTIEFYMTYLKERFSPGMTWENRALWEIDHIKPVSRFDLTKPEDQHAAFHFTNTQPLWKPDNARKGARLAA